MRSTGKVKGGADIGSMADMASASQFQLQQATTQASQVASAQSNTAKKASDTQNAIITNLRG